MLGAAPGNVKVIEACLVLEDLGRGAVVTDKSTHDPLRYKKENHWHFL